MKKFNINDFIKVKLTSFGKDVYYHQYDDWNKKYNLVVPITPMELKVDEDGFTEFQLWDFMNIFGKYFFNGSVEQIMERNNIYFDDTYLKEV